MISMAVHPVLANPEAAQQVPSRMIIHAIRWFEAGSGVEGEAGEAAATSFQYVPGAGDDEETWAATLTPALLWKHRERLLGAGPAKIAGVAAQLSAAAREPVEVQPWDHIQTSPATGAPTGLVCNRFISCGSLLD